MRYFPYSYLYRARTLRFFMLKILRLVLVEGQRKVRPVIWTSKRPIKITRVHRATINSFGLVGATPMGTCRGGCFFFGFQVFFVMFLLLSRCLRTSSWCQERTPAVFSLPFSLPRPRDLKSIIIPKEIIQYGLLSSTAERTSSGEQRKKPTSKQYVHK